jgi:hypothetical protein
MLIHDINLPFTVHIHTTNETRKKTYEKRLRIEINDLLRKSRHPDLKRDELMDKWWTKTETLKPFLTPGLFKGVKFFDLDTDRYFNLMRNPGKKASAQVKAAYGFVDDSVEEDPVFDLG